MSDAFGALNIVVCDDHESECNSIADAVESIAGVETKRLFGDDLRKHLKRLDLRANAIVKADSSPPDSDSHFDDADIIFIDYRLEELSGAEPFSLTAENMIGKIRIFAGAKYIVSINVFPEIDFDLKDLFGARESSADLAIIARNVSEPSLWGKGAAEDGFCPSYWPNIVEASRRRQNQVEAIRSNLETSVLNFLGFDEARKSHLTVDALSSMLPRSSDREDPKIARFIDIFETASEDVPLALVKQLQQRYDSNGSPQLNDIIA